MALTDKQQRFIDEYMKDLNATQAAIRAGYSEKVAKEIGYENLTKPHIKSEIDKRLKELTEKCGVTAEAVINELAHIAFDDIKNYLRFYPGKNGEIKMDIKDSDTIDTRAVSEVSVGKDGQFKFKLYCKDNALVQLGKNLGLFAEKVEATNYNYNTDVEKLSDEELDEELKKYGVDINKL